MGFAWINLRPGVNTEATTNYNEAGISNSQLIRWRQGLPQKMGGWARYLTGTVGSITRAMNSWIDNSANKWLGLGSLLSLQVAQNGGTATDITPDELTTNPALNLTTTAGSTTVTIVDTGLTGDLWQYDVVHFNTPIAVGGLVLTGMYPINTGAAGTTYTITSLTPAPSAAAATGAVPSFATTSGSATVIVTLTSHGLVDGSYFTFPIATTVGGLTITGTYRVSQSLTANTFSIVTASVASSTTSASMNSGLAQYHYYLTDSAPTSAFSGGMGAIGELAIGEGSFTAVSSSRQTGTPIVSTDWTLANWGEFLMACQRGGPIFYWPPNQGFTAAIAIGVGPPFSRGIFMAMPQQMLVAYGTAASLTDPGRRSEVDPLMVRWTHVADFFTWRASSRNQAGSFRLSSGSEIRGGIQGSNQSFLFTDTNTWVMHYLGPPNVFGFVSIGEVGIAGPHAVAELNGIIYYVNTSNIYRVGAGSSNIQPVPCTVWSTMFQDLDTANAGKIVVSSNSLFNEITIFYPSISGGTGENDKYIKYNTVENLWDVGTLPRSAWIDASIFPNPLAADPTTTLIQAHESGFDADGTAMTAFYQSGDMAYGEGEDFAVIDHFEPDMIWVDPTGTSTPATVDVTINTKKYPNSGVSMTNSFSMNSTTPYLAPRVRGRTVNWRIGSSDLNSFWRHGKIRYRYGVDGRQ